MVLTSDPTVDTSPAAVRGRVRFSLAGAQDDGAICEFLQAQAMAGRMRLSVRTRPSFLAAAALQGDRAEVLVAKPVEGGAIVGLGVRATRRVYVAGGETRIGHLSYLRIAPQCRAQRDFLLAGYGLLKTLDERDPVPFYLTAILEDNRPARRLLEAGLRGLPVYAPVTSVRTFTFSTGQRFRCAQSASGVCTEESAEVSAWLDEQMRGRPLGSVDTSLAASMHVLRRGSRIVAAASYADQRAIRQHVVEGYDWTLRSLRPLINAWRCVGGMAALPRAGSVLNLGYVSQFAVPGGDGDDLVALLKGLAAHARAAGIDYLALSLPVADPLCACAVKSAAHITRSILYSVRWVDRGTAPQSAGIAAAQAGSEDDRGIAFLNVHAAYVEASRL